MERALAEVSQLLLSDVAAADVLGTLCEHARQVLDVDGAGVSVPETDNVHLAWAAGPHAQELEELQGELGEGPCLEVVRSGRQVHAQLNDEPDRWPVYGPQPGASGAAA